MLKIALIANSGGHMSELRAIQPAFEGHDCFYITLRRPWHKSLAPCFFIGPPKEKLPRKLALGIYLVTAFFHVCWVILKTRPDLVVSTGAELAIPAFWMAKLLGARTLFLESLTRYDRPSRAGRFVMPVADVFLTQQEQMVASDPKHIRYEGNIF